LHAGSEAARPFSPEERYANAESITHSHFFALFGTHTDLIRAATMPRVFSTFLQGGSSITQIAVDPNGGLYVLGQMQESPIPSHGVDLFVAKLNLDATAVQYFVYLGGGSTDVGDALAVDAASIRFAPSPTY
jgi:hypothetical protein